MFSVLASIFVYVVQLCPLCKIRSIDFSYK